MMRQNFIVFAEKWKWTTNWSNEIFLKKEQQTDKKREMGRNNIYIYIAENKENFRRNNDKRIQQKKKTPKSKSIRLVRKMKIE